MSWYKKLLVGMLAAATGCAHVGHSIRKPSINDIILENAKVHQTVMFGEDHMTFFDNKYVISLLPKLKQLGYKDICLEIDSPDQQFVDDYVSGRIGKLEFLRNVQYYNPNFDILKSAKELGYKIHCIDKRPKLSSIKDAYLIFSSDRDCEMYENMKERIFDKKPNAKVVVFIGAAHISESGFPNPLTKKDEIMLGQTLEEKLKGNYSINLTKSNRFKNVDLDIPVLLRD